MKLGTGEPAGLLAGPPAAVSRRLLAGARLVAGIGILVWLLRAADWIAIRALLPHVNRSLILGCCLFYVLLQLLSTLKWQLLLRARGVRLRFPTLARIYFIGMFCNLFLPTSVGGDAVRSYLTWRQGVLPETAVATILVERATGFAAMLVIGVLGAATAPVPVTRGALALFGLGAAAIVGLVLVVLLLRRAGNGGGAASPLRGKLARMGAAFEGFGSPRWVPAAVMGLSFVFQSGMVALQMALLAACGYRAPLAAMAFFVPLMTIAALLPVSTNGLGIRETVSIYLLGQLHLPATVGLVTSLLWQVVVALASLPGLLLWIRSSRAEAAGAGGDAAPQQGG